MQGHEVVAKAAEEGGDHDKEHHQDAVIGDHHVPEVSVGGAGLAGREEAEALQAHVLNARMHELEAHEHGETDSDQAGESRNDQIKQTNIFVICRKEPARKEAAVIFVVVAVNGCVCHACLPLVQKIGIRQGESSGNPCAHTGCIIYTF